ncbi:hypothetical protein T484DRAFT_1900964 [Baffinella frigidus]|nr:hypothetical protein T484DRAFT_1900964 [Cryptophyta sp. CCMP2293]
MQGSGHEQQQLSVDLVCQAADHRRFLAAVHLSPLSLYARSPDLERAINDYSRIFLPLLAGWTAASPPPPPPIEVAWVWQLHKLDPRAYERDCVKAFGRVVGVHPGQNPFTAATACGAPAACSEEEEGSREEEDQTTAVSITTDIAASAERQAVFLWQVRWAEYSEETWLTEAETRYRMMLRLMGQNHARFIVPTYDIDLMWHTHMAFPEDYRKDSLRLAGRVVPHDDSVNDRSEGSKLAICAANTQKVWMELYSTSWARPGGMWRGEPPPWYFQDRGIAADLFGAEPAISARCAAEAQEEVMAAAMEVACVPRFTKTSRGCTPPLVAAPAPILSMTVSGKAMGTAPTTAITVPGWGHFAPVPGKVGKAEQPQTVETTFTADQVRQLAPPPGRPPNADIRYFAIPYPGPEYEGDRLFFALPSGERVSVVVPSGIPSGTTLPLVAPVDLQRIESARFCSCCLKDPTPARLIAPLPAAEFPERPGHFRTQVPAGVTEGQTVEVQVPPGYPQSGMLQKFTVPPGLGLLGYVYVPLPAEGGGGASGGMGAAAAGVGAGVAVVAVVSVSTEGATGGGGVGAAACGGAVHAR